jgi:C4-dicarboxylate transporter, DctM subunit
MTIAFLFISLFTLLIIGAPIAIALGLASVSTILLFSGDDLGSLAGKLFDTMHHYTLMAIPFFILSSAFLSTGGVARRLIRFAVNLVGHFPGGLAMSSVLACILFAAVSGSSPATVVAIGSIVIVGMMNSGYSREFAAGLVANAGTLGILIPPSIVMVVYAAATDVSVGRMFLGGVIPGLIAGLMLMVGIYVVARIKNLPRQPWPGATELWKSFYDAIWGILLVFIIMGGIYGGIFTPTEAAAVAAVYAYIIAIFVYRDIGPLRRDKPRESLFKVVTGFFVHEDVVKTLLDGARVTIMLMFIIANAMLFAHVLTTERIPHAITEWILTMGFQPWTFLLMVNILLILAGDFMEPSAILLIMAPILFPIAVQLDIDPIHLGIMMVVNMEIGMVTPPVGLNLFVTASITGMSLTQVLRAALPWMGILIAFLILVTYVPFISTWLPNLMMGPEIVR